MLNKIQEIIVKPQENIFMNDKCSKQISFKHFNRKGDQLMQESIGKPVSPRGHLYGKSPGSRSAQRWIPIRLLLKLTLTNL